MTDTNNGFNVGLLLSILCLGMLFIGGWYFQSSIIELSTLMAEQQETIMEQVIGQTKEISEQAAKIAEQEKIIQQLQEMQYEQKKRLNKLLLQQYFEKSQSQVAKCN